ncbi:hypothetical protein [Actinomadura sp. HBU206391]|uniref:hypothetical protein n=1 Tax=Actinomadura sp. HBU206391 TaxID=2731692 RepID=UPI00164F9F82|nr:hypothetical protein [Actinomadura sp. HBU206391]MBC6462625.1 hypothetical protein [Actinomadura sp. HBU206391]
MTLLWRVLAMMIFCSGCLDSGPAKKAPVDKAPAGKTPAGKTPAGKAPVTEAKPAATGETSSSPEAATTVLTKAEAAERYLQSVRPYNTALDDFEAAVHADRPWADLRTLAGRVAAANAAQVRVLRETTWPHEAREQVTALMTASVRAGRYWSTAAGADGPDQFKAAVLRAAALSGKPEATALRHALGLPSDPQG